MNNMYRLSRWKFLTHGGQFPEKNPKRPSEKEKIKHSKKSCKKGGILFIPQSDVQDLAKIDLHEP